MRLHLEIRLSCAVALLSVWLAACGNDMTTAKPCAALCEEEHADGLADYNNLKAKCACTGCTEECEQSVCYDKQPPSDECLPCVQQSLQGDACKVHSAHFKSGCLDTEACGALVACITSCGQ